MQHNIKKKWLFPYPPNGQYNLLQIDDESVRYITPPQTSCKMAKILNKMCDTKNLTMFDATAGCGGDTIMFGSIFKKVIACEINTPRYMMLTNNVNIFNLHNIEILNTDSLTHLSTCDDVDVVYIDPPWGGSGYKFIEKLKLKFGDIDISELIIKIFNKQQTQSNVKLVALKLPTNYDFNDLSSSLLTAKLIPHFYPIGKIMFVTVVHLEL